MDRTESMGMATSVLPCTDLCGQDADGTAHDWHCGCMFRPAVAALLAKVEAEAALRERDRCANIADEQGDIRVDSEDAETYKRACSHVAAKIRGGGA